MTDLDDLRDELSDFAPTKKERTLSPVEERILAGFDEITDYVKKVGYEPSPSESAGIFEQLYAARLEQLRGLREFHGLLKTHDTLNLLDSTEFDASLDNPSDDLDSLVNELSLPEQSSSISVLKFVSPTATRRSAEEIAQREVCVDFASFAKQFEQVRAELQSGARQALKLKAKTLEDIQQGSYFIVEGQIAYVDELGSEFQTEYGRRNLRVRVIYDNGTEQAVLIRSFQRALHRDDTARIISEVSPGPLFGSELEECDVDTGTIYVLRSHSDHPFIKEHRDLVHKIGVTGGDVAKRISGAKLDPTYLMSDVEVVATYKLARINCKKLERLFHQFFETAKLELTLYDRFDNPVKPREWFLVPLELIDEAVQRFRDGSIVNYRYDAAVAELIKIN